MHQAAQLWARLRCRREAQTKHLNTPVLTFSFLAQPRICAAQGTACSACQHPNKPDQGQQRPESQLRLPSSHILWLPGRKGIQHRTRTEGPAPSCPLPWDACPDPSPSFVLGAHRPQNHTGCPSVGARGRGACLAPRCKELSPRSVDISERLPKSAKTGSALIGCVPAGSN